MKGTSSMTGVVLLRSVLDSWQRSVNESINRSEREKAELLQKLEKAEKKNEELSSYSRGTGGGSYDESGPAPPKLQKALESVKSDLEACSGTIFRFIRSVSAGDDDNSPKNPDGVIRVSDCSFPDIERVVCSTIYKSFRCDGTSQPYLEARDSHDSKLVLQALLCSIFFAESCSNWGFPSTPPVFRRPDQFKSDLFQIYRLCGSDDILLEVLIDGDFWDDIVKYICTRNDHPHDAAHHHQLRDFSTIVIPDNLKSVLQDLRHFLLRALQSKQLCELTYHGKPVLPKGLLHDIEFKVSFVRLARNAWLMHKLAFSFKPPAEMIRVPPGSPFDQDFMEDRTPFLEDFTVGVDADVTGSSSCRGDQDLAKGVGDRLVAFMCVPGFTVRSIVIKSQVVCIATAALNEDQVQLLPKCLRVGFLEDNI